MSKIKMVVLDMAGTTINENNVVYKTLYKVIKNSVAEVSLKTVLEVGAGKEKHQAIKDILAYVKANQKEDSLIIFERFKKELNEAYKVLDIKPIKGVTETILNLRNKGILVVLNTGYNSLVANNLLQKINWQKGQHYDALITASDVINGRPHPDMIIKAMALFNITDVSLVLKAGDSVIDIEEGKNANCGITVGVLSGAQTRNQLEKIKPTYILESLATLETIL